ncbi:hypothetical protein GUITHDRAFT_115005 [Guillardia theta CCMP2712]|uniref:Uncharacterized protein n=3 Tax=Eukaryota TaxID=2759 RepID=L1IRK8_GUITC|nr:hypothetical protein GUITHDRAFT_115005 [Guillardia theta CCMP2712]EKX38901.1 hypothetical protein GUITHDRAFT_115005 [Guillardia theta CCMP2712]|mmetsp:Transcript_35103/g.109702  ORF Transcript_35103/g.109702 Transcript_35103/m.109702 type:complete len:135 (+) Transcript_35103:53-457(+)|eukprot:XP_005825881.1 hypothetical protein GUITHDRAFT_115005 [Guillardia theta CCMP2712]
MVASKGDNSGFSSPARLRVSLSQGGSFKEKRSRSPNTLDETLFDRLERMRVSSPKLTRSRSQGETIWHARQSPTPILFRRCKQSHLDLKVDVNALEIKDTCEPEPQAPRSHPSWSINSEDSPMDCEKQHFFSES